MLVAYKINFNLEDYMKKLLLICFCIGKIYASEPLNANEVSPEVRKAYDLRTVSILAKSVCYLQKNRESNLGNLCNTYNHGEEWSYEDPKHRASLNQYAKAYNQLTPSQQQELSALIKARSKS